MRALPAELSVTELALLLNVPRERIRRRVDSGRIPSTKTGDGSTSKRVIYLATLRRELPELYDAVLLKAQELPDDED